MSMPIFQALMLQLNILGKERNQAYPAKNYPTRALFEEKLEELAKVASLEIKGQKIASENLTFQDSPVFIGGFFKSGTTLLNSLFDFHPEVVALPPGFRLIDFIRPKALSLKRNDFFELLATHAVKMLYNPTGKFPMNLLNEGDLEKLEIKPYVQFLTYLKKFVFQARTQSEILSSVARALYLVNGQKERGDLPKIWVEKTVANEKDVKLIKKIFPKAKFIYIERNPLDNLSSISRWYQSSSRKKISNPYLYFWDLRSSRKRAKRFLNRRDFLSLKYKDLVQSPREELSKICSFLAIKYDLSLERPSILGALNTPNISDQADSNKRIAGEIITSRVNNYQTLLTEKQIEDIKAFFNLPPLKANLVFIF